MKTKIYLSFFTILLLLFSSFGVNAQLKSNWVNPTAKGRFFLSADIGGNFNFLNSTAKKNGVLISKSNETKLDMRFGIGYSFFENFEAGLNLGINTINGSSESYDPIRKSYKEGTGLEYGLYTKYYFSSDKKLKPFLIARIGNIHNTAFDRSRITHFYGGGIGLSYFFTKNIGIQGSYEMLRRSTEFTSNIGDFDFKTTEGNLKFGIIIAF